MTERDKSTVLLEHYLKKLKLPTMLREYTAVATVCQKDRSDFPIYLLRLAERELLDREKRAAERRIKDANFPVIKTIDTYDFSAQPSVNEPLIRELLRGEYLDKRENVLLIGNPGTAKTHLVSALAFSALPRVEPFASIPPPIWSLSLWSAGRKNDFSEYMDAAGELAGGTTVRVFSLP